MANNPPPPCLSSSSSSSFLFFFFLFFSPASIALAHVYIVTLDSPPAAHHTFDAPHKLSLDRLLQVQAYYARLEARHDELLSSYFELGSYRKLYSYTHVLNGFAVQMSHEQAEMMKGMAEVKGVERGDWKLEKRTTHTPEFLGLTSRVWPREGGPSGAGEGMVIGIIDTGIDPSHPSFSVDGGGVVPYPPLSDSSFHGRCEASSSSSYPSFCNGKIIAAQHFAAAAIASGAFNSSQDFASPLDGDGHGSHTASIAAGNHGVFVNYNGFYFGDASGMAPRARISVYKALYRQFGGFVSDVVAAIDQATKDGVHVLSLSVGPSSPPSNIRLTYLNAFDVALLSATKSGVFVVQAAGNGGPYPRTMSSFSPWIMSVAAGLDDRSYANQLYLGNGEIISGIGLAPATPGGDEMYYELVLAEDACAQDEEGDMAMSYKAATCQHPEVFNKSLVQGKILMCTYSFSFVYGAASVSRVSETAESLGAVGFVLFAKTDLPGNKFNPIPFAIPGIVVTDVQSSLNLIEYYNNRSKVSGDGNDAGPQAKLGDGMNPTLKGSAAPQVALFSSRGPSVKDFSLEDADVLKPNLLAPGSLIWGAWSSLGTDEVDFQGQRFALMSGTSMATPHVAGVAALIRQFHPDWSPAAVASAMMTTASVVDMNGSPLLAQRYSTDGSVILDPATPFDFGHGALNATAALDPGLIFDAGYGDYINFLCAMSEVDETQVLNATGSVCEVSSKARRAVDLNTPSIVMSNMQNTKTIMRTVTNVAGRTEAYKVSVVAPTDVDMEVVPESFTIPEGGTVSLSVVVRAMSTSAKADYSFGSIVLEGDAGHVVRMQVAVRIGTQI